MRRSRALKRGRWFPLLAAGVVGYVLGDWHTIALRTAELTASQAVALRFPEAKAESAELGFGPEMPVRATNAIVLGDTSAALLSPAPMIFSAVQQAAAPQAPAPAPIRVATATDVAPLPAVAAAPARRALAITTQAKPEVKPEAGPDAKPEAKTEAKAEARPVAGVQPTSELKTAAIAPGDVVRRASRQGFVLNDAQIAAIKSRLHLSPDQEQMWPAVEAALRTIAYSKTREGRRRGGATSTEVASLDPYGPEVQGLKSAAFPLIMSFSDEQRSEVRGIAHVMGLDQLASQL